ncbi:response regulator [Sphingomonas sp. SFZ2018-12]|uniref:response regulator transcription factor n=1 Tax=Sphingomonas sp. SFZ2018-12 TaxID=2683197 RepID=UPI001F0F58E2|nr:response regulator [Sphingomonas sp. SFZ2018-12]MCH4892557.1 response regulator [Sphingomonas sp. SFZ2018-12]
MRAVYLVDDDDIIRNLLRDVLSGIPDLLLFPFRAGNDFIAALPDLAGGVLMLDMKMPGMSGLDVLEAIHRQEGRFTTILMTSRPAVADVVKCIKMGAYDFLEKPIDPGALVDCIESALESLWETRAKLAARAEAMKRINRLTDRELGILDLMVDGLPNKVIADRLSLSTRTVEVHRASLMAKIGAESLSAAVRMAVLANPYILQELP